MTDKESLKEFDFVKFAQQKVNEAIINGTDSLVLEGFGLDELPKNIEYINSKSLFLGQNKIGCIPDELISNLKNTQELLRYLSHRERIPLNELKLILVGEANVGKSAIVERLTEGTFRHERIVTEGIDIKTWQATPTPSPSPCGGGARGGGGTVTNHD